MTKPESESETKAAITELIKAGVADPATLVLLRAIQEVLREVDEIKALVNRVNTVVSRFETVLEWNDQAVLNSFDYRMMDLLAKRRRRQ
jgi:hypothetical protein